MRLVNIHHYLDRKVGVSLKDCELNASQNGCGIYCENSGVIITNSSLKLNLTGA